MLDFPDVVVVGGGTGGVTAALAAAELGASVAVVDRDSGLGGVGTRAGVHFYYWGQRGGLQDALDKQVRGATSSRWGAVRGFHPLAKQVTVETRLAEAGVEIITGAVVAGVILEDGRITAVDVEHPEGRRRLWTHVVIDATGNGDVAALAGARFHVGRAWDQVMNTYSYVPRYLDAEGRLTFANYDCGWLDSTDPDDVSRALATGRDVGLRRVRAQSGHTLLALGPQLGVREGRRVVGLETIRQSDVFDNAVRADIVFRCRTHHDTHARDYANESDLAQLWVPVLGWRKRSFRGDIPYGALVARDVDGLLIGCRALSGDQDVAAGVRMQRDMHRLGEAAGVAAGLAVSRGVAPREVPVAHLQAHLRDRGVLDDLPTSSVPDGPESVEQALELLGGEDESSALWWFRRSPGVPRGPLIEMLSDAEPRRRRGAAFALAMMGDAAGHAVLREVVRDGDVDAPGDSWVDLAAPRWLAALILLRIGRDPGVHDVVTARLAAGEDSATTLYLLHYLHDLAPELDAAQSAAARSAVEQALARPGLGEDYAVQSSERSDPREATLSSIAWNVELTASATLEALGSDGAALRDRWRHSGRGAARRFVRHLERRGDPGEERQRPLPDREVDLVVAGGGVSGVAAALEAAASGSRVMLVEPGPVLGREVSAARRTALGPDPLVDPLLVELARRGCAEGEHLDAMAVSAALDEICADAGVQMLLLATPGDALLSAEGTLTGLAVTTIAGPLTVRAGALIDATQAGRVMGRWSTEVSRDERTGIALLVRDSLVSSRQHWRPSGAAPGTELVMEPLPRPGWARVTLVAPVVSIPASGLVAMAVEAFGEAAAQIPELRAATLALPADEPLDPASGRRRLVRIENAPDRLVGAGGWLPAAPDVSAHDRDVLDHHLRSGRHAARSLQPVIAG